MRFRELEYRVRFFFLDRSLKKRVASRRKHLELDKNLLNLVLLFAEKSEFEMASFLIKKIKNDA